ncbi:HVA22-like protein i [Impatiens glandulifera]|uniref:HVA22-like protein i n=1 Tax=Impatiens glandulifera TaxID=253017 RepID=UPI001FB0E18A|nr:HVA22-like protein i [Impatiens glandulifera]XP_047318893.1 HVA22-like protein i [Impatiens glandulifera]
MLGEAITRGLLMVLGYAYPALECFKAMEKKKSDIEELRFWCQYWVIVAVLTILERFGDAFISWLPMYGELKLALVIYLWYPKTKGSGYIYENILQPYVSRHELDFDHNLRVLRAKVWDLAIYYWHNSTELGQAATSQILQRLTSQQPEKPDKSKKK